MATTTTTPQDPLKPKGFLATAMQPGTTPAAPTTSAATPYIKPETDTVEGRLTSMLGKDSDYMKRAETKGLQVANKRGLLNSSMAAGAAQAASIDAALPVAQQDANTYSGFATRNQQVDQQKDLNEQQFGQQRALDADQFAQERAVKQWEQDNLVFSQLIKGISDIQMQQDLSPVAKLAATQELERMYSSRNSKIGASLLDVDIVDGKVVRQPSTGGDTTGEGASGAEGTTQPKSMFDYPSVDAMPPEIKAEYKATYGNLSLPTAQQLKLLVDYNVYEYGPPPRVDNSNYKSVLSSKKAISKWIEPLSTELRKSGVTINKDVEQALSNLTGLKP